MFKISPLPVLELCLVSNKAFLEFLKKFYEICMWRFSSPLTDRIFEVKVKFLSGFQIFNVCGVLFF